VVGYTWVKKGWCFKCNTRRSHPKRPAPRAPRHPFQKNRLKNGTPILPKEVPKRPEKHATQTRPASDAHETPLIYYNSPPLITLDKLNILLHWSRFKCWHYTIFYFLLASHWLNWPVDDKSIAQKELNN